MVYCKHQLYSVQAEMSLTRRMADFHNSSASLPLMSYKIMLLSFEALTNQFGFKMCSIDVKIITVVLQEDSK